MRFPAVSLACVLTLPVSAVAQTAPDGTAGAAIGYAAAIAFAGDELAVGRSAAVTGFPMPSAAPGVVYLYRRSGSGWVESGKLQAADATVGDAFGSSLVHVTTCISRQ